MRKLALSVVACLLVACSSIGLAPAQNMEQRLAYGYSQTTGLRNAAATALENHRIGKPDATAVLEVTNQVRTLLDASKAANDVGDITTAEARLTLAVSLLTALQNRLNESSRRPS